MALTYTTAQDELDIILGDSSDTTFTPEEKQRALKKAWNDSYVVEVVWDSTQTFDTNTYRQAIPAALTTLKGIYLSRGNSTDEFPDPLAGDLYEVIDGYIHWSSQAGRIIPDGYTLYLKGHKKLTTDDTLPSVNLDEYVLALAGVNTLSLLGHKKANLFLKNDTTMAELVTFRRELQADVREARNRLLKEFEAA